METVMIVDDNEENCELVGDILSTWGYDVYKIFQGKDAIALAERKQPDVILLDVMLPGMNGFEVCHELKSNSRTQDIPIIMLSVLSDADDRIHGLKVGADNYLTKPVNYHELRYIIASAVRRKKLNDQMEQRQNIIDSFLQMYKIFNEELYCHVIMVHKYCLKLSAIMNYSDGQKERLLAAAYLHDIGYLVSAVHEQHAKYGAKIITAYKMGEWLKILIENHHEPLNGNNFPRQSVAEAGLQVEMEALLTVNWFVNLCKQQTKEQSLAVLLEQAQQHKCSAIVVNALQQIVKDDQFREQLGVRTVADPES